MARSDTTVFVARVVVEKEDDRVVCADESEGGRVRNNLEEVLRVDCCSFTNINNGYITAFIAGRRLPDTDAF
jgi:hypothetical protein